MNSREQFVNKLETELKSKLEGGQDLSPAELRSYIKALQADLDLVFSKHPDLLLESFNQAYERLSTLEKTTEAERSVLRDSLHYLRAIELHFVLELFFSSSKMKNFSIDKIVNGFPIKLTIKDLKLLTAQASKSGLVSNYLEILAQQIRLGFVELDYTVQTPKDYGVVMVLKSIFDLPEQQVTQPASLTNTDVDKFYEGLLSVGNLNWNIYENLNLPSSVPSTFQNLETLLKQGHRFFKSGSKYTIYISENALDSFRSQPRFQTATYKQLQGLLGSNSTLVSTSLSGLLSNNCLELYNAHSNISVAPKDLIQVLTLPGPFNFTKLDMKNKDEYVRVLREKVEQNNYFLTSPGSIKRTFGLLRFLEITEAEKIYQDVVRKVYYNNELFLKQQYRRFGFDVSLNDNSTKFLIKAKRNQFMFVSEDGKTEILEFEMDPEFACNVDLFVNTAQVFRNTNRQISIAKFMQFDSTVAAALKEPKVTAPSAPVEEPKQPIILSSQKSNTPVGTPDSKLRGPMTSPEPSLFTYDKGGFLMNWNLSPQQAQGPLASPPPLLQQQPTQESKPEQSASQKSQEPPPAVQPPPVESSSAKPTPAKLSTAKQSSEKSSQVQASPVKAEQSKPDQSKPESPVNAAPPKQREVSVAESTSLQGGTGPLLPGIVPGFYSNYLRFREPGASGSMELLPPGSQQGSKQNQELPKIELMDLAEAQLKHNALMIKITNFKKITSLRTLSNVYKNADGVKTGDIDFKKKDYIVVGLIDQKVITRTKQSNESGHNTNDYNGVYNLSTLQARFGGNAMIPSDTILANPIPNEIKFAEKFLLAGYQLEVKTIDGKKKYRFIDGKQLNDDGSNCSNWFSLESTAKVLEPKPLIILKDTHGYEVEEKNIYIKSYETSEQDLEGFELIYFKNKSSVFQYTEPKGNYKVNFVISKNREHYYASLFKHKEYMNYSFDQAELHGWYSTNQVRIKQLLPLSQLSKDDTLTQLPLAYQYFINILFLNDAKRNRFPYVKVVGARGSLSVGLKSNKALRRIDYEIDANSLAQLSNGDLFPDLPLKGLSGRDVEELNLGLSLYKRSPQDESIFVSHMQYSYRPDGQGMDILRLAVDHLPMPKALNESKYNQLKQVWFERFGVINLDFKMDLLYQNPTKRLAHLNADQRSVYYELVKTFLTDPQYAKIITHLPAAILLTATEYNVEDANLSSVEPLSEKEHSALNYLKTLRYGKSSMFFQFNSKGLLTKIAGKALKTPFKIPAMAYVSFKLDHKGSWLQNFLKVRYFNNEGKIVLKKIKFSNSQVIDWRVFRDTIRAMRTHVNRELEYDPQNLLINSEGSLVFNPMYAQKVRVLGSSLKAPTELKFKPGSKVYIESVGESVNGRSEVVARVIAPDGTGMVVRLQVVAGLFKHFRNPNLPKSNVASHSKLKMTLHSLHFTHQLGSKHLRTHIAIRDASLHSLIISKNAIQYFAQNPISDLKFNFINVTKFFNLHEDGKKFQIYYQGPWIDFNKSNIDYLNTLARKHERGQTDFRSKLYKHYLSTSQTKKRIFQLNARDNIEIRCNDAFGVIIGVLIRSYSQVTLQSGYSYYQPPVGNYLYIKDTDGNVTVIKYEDWLKANVNPKPKRRRTSKSSTNRTTIQPSSTVAPTKSQGLSVEEKEASVIVPARKPTPKPPTSPTAPTRKPAPPKPTRAPKPAPKPAPKLSAGLNLDELSEVQQNKLRGHFRQQMLGAMGKAKVLGWLTVGLKLDGTKATYYIGYKSGSVTVARDGQKKVQELQNKHAVVLKRRLEQALPDNLGKGLAGKQLRVKDIKWDIKAVGGPKVIVTFE